MTDGYKDLTHKHRSAEAVHRRYRERGGDEVAREYCLMVSRFVTAEELALTPLLRHTASGADLADEMEGRSAAIKHLIARVFETPPPDLGDLLAALGEAVAAYTDTVEDQVFPHLRDQGIESASVAGALETAREQMHTEQTTARH